MKRYGIWLMVLLAFLATSLVSAQLLYLARAESALKESQRAKDAVLAAVSHDLRTPLTTIKGLAHEIGAAGDERAAIIEEEADRLSGLVSSLLDLSRVTSGVAAADVQANEAEDLLGAAAQQVRGLLDGRELRIHVRSARRAPVRAIRFLANAARAGESDRQRRQVLAGRRAD